MDRDTEKMLTLIANRSIVKAVLTEPEGQGLVKDSVGWLEVRCDESMTWESIGGGRYIGRGAKIRSAANDTIDWGVDEDWIENTRLNATLEADIVVSLYGYDGRFDDATLVKAGKPGTIGADYQAVSHVTMIKVIKDTSGAEFMANLGAAMGADDGDDSSSGFTVRLGWVD